MWKYGQIENDFFETRKKQSKGYPKNKAFNSWSNKDNSDNEQYNSSIICFKVVEDSYEVTTETYDSCEHLNCFSDCATNYLNWIFDSLKNFKKKKRTWKLS